MSQTLDDTADSDALESSPRIDQPSFENQPLRGAVLQQTTRGWSIHCGGKTRPFELDDSPEAVAAELAQLIEQSPGVDQRCVLALHSTECFFANLSLPESIDVRDQTAISYEIENHVPLDAESMVSDHMPVGSNKQIAAVAIETERHRAIVQSLENAGIEIVGIVPASFLVARGARRWRRQSTSFELVLFNQGLVEWMMVDADGVSRWSVFCDGSDQWVRHHQAFAGETNGERPIVLVDKDELAHSIDAPIQHCPLSIEQLVESGSTLLLSGKWGKWPNLRRGSLAPQDPLYAVAGRLRLLALAALVSVLVVSGAAMFRQARLTRESEQINAQCREEFQKTFPRRRVPIMLMRTIRDEHRKALGSHGQGDAIEPPIAATEVLHDIFAGLHSARQDGVRFRVIDLNIEDGSCSLTVRTTRAIEIGSIAKSLETVGLQVNPPATEQIAPSRDERVATYQSTIVATRVSQPNQSTGAAQ